MTKVLNNLRQKERIALTTIFTVIFSLLVFDVYEDLNAGASLAHVAVETGILILTICGIVLQWSIFFSQKKDIETLNFDLDRARVDLTKYKGDSRKFVEGLANEIDRQLSEWKLTNAEKEITLLILKGLTNKEVGEVRGTSERTIRQQVTSIFQKSNLRSRLELSTYFLEDLIVNPNIK